MPRTPTAPFFFCGISLASNLKKYSLSERRPTVSEPTRESNGNAGENTGENTPGKVAGKLQIIKNVNMRNRPSTENSSILGVAKTGEVYEYYELVGDSWYHIRLSDGSEAYVYKEYVDVLN